MQTIDCLIVGSGEYTTGFGASAGSDKASGVIALTLFDLRQRLGIVGSISIAGTNGKKFPGIRKHISAAIGERYSGTFTSPEDLSFSSFPDDATVDPEAYLEAITNMPKGSAVLIFTPDDTHFDIALRSVQLGHHVLVTKPIVMTLDHHQRLIEAAERANVLVAVELHKRFDPFYVDARNRIRKLGDISYFNAYMSQPKGQLGVFKEWAGKRSDISYYLNSHHIDFSEWAFGDIARPLSVVARYAPLPDNTR